MEEAIAAGNTSGNVLNCYYQRKLQMHNEKQLCSNAIVTQRHFFNSIHRDKSAILSHKSKNMILNNLKEVKHNKDINENRYINEILRDCNNNLPKSTTCCWSLRKKYDGLKLLQFFVSPELKFGLNLSSQILFNNNSVGATFLSSLFLHATTIPIWIDDKDFIFLKGPQDMYNFAWGSNGNNKETY